MKRRNFLKLIPGAAVGVAGVAVAPSLLAGDYNKDLGYPNGTPMCPVDTYEDALYLAEKYNIHVDQISIWNRRLSDDKIRWVHDLKST